MSQWETGAARVGHGTVRRYERLLGLPVNRLAAVAAGLPGTDGDPAGPETRTRTWHLLDRGLSGDADERPGAGTT